MSLLTMQSMEVVRFLDDLDITLSLDSARSTERQMTSIELNMRPVTLRASIVEINLISSILLRALALYNEQSKPAMNPPKSLTDVRGSSTQSPARTRGTAMHARAKSSMDKPRVHLSKEKVCISFRHLIFILSIDSSQLCSSKLASRGFD